MSDTVNATESAMKLAEAEGLDLSTVTGTGAEGRITKADAEQALAARDDAGAAGEGPSDGGSSGDGATVTLSRNAPFAAIDLPASDPSIVLRRGESAHAPKAVIEALREAARAGAIPPELARRIDIDGEPLAE